MLPLAKLAAVLPLLASHCAAQSFVVSGGQIFTPGFAVVNAPQPGTPLGGETLHISLDITANGKLNIPPYVDESPSLIHNISVFLYSYNTGRNFTVVNLDEAPDGDIMAQEPGSSVKHINWRWPDCLVGDGQPRDADSDRGVYNISIRQSFRLNDAEHYTVFDLPIAVTNNIPQMNNRPACDSVSNAMMAPEDIDMSSTQAVGVLFAPGDSTVVEAVLPEEFDGENGLGGQKPEATPEDGIGAAGSLDWRSGAHWLSLLSLAVAFL